METRSRTRRRALGACARENRPPSIAADVHAGRAATTLVLSAAESIASGQPVEVAL